MRSARKSASNLLLWSDVSVMATLSLSAVGCLRWKSNVTLSADHLFALELSGESSKIWLNFHLTHTTASKSQDEMKSRLFLDIVVREGFAIFKYFSSPDEFVVIRRNTFLVLDL